MQTTRFLDAVSRGLIPGNAEMEFEGREMRVHEVVATIKQRQAQKKAETDPLVHQQLVRME